MGNAIDWLSPVAAAYDAFNPSNNNQDLQNQTKQQLQEQQNKLDAQQKQADSLKKSQEAQLNAKQLKSLQLFGGASGLTNPAPSSSVLG